MTGLPVHRPTVDTFGGSPFATHDQACAACQERHAVIDLSTGLFQPCWECQGRGYVLIRRPKWRRRLVRWWHGI